MSEKKYEVVIHGDETAYEVSVADVNNKLAKSSWGWYGINKILIECKQCEGKKEDFEIAKKLAEKVCKGINS
jgi:hypothetical protein